MKPNTFKTDLIRRERPSWIDYQLEVRKSASRKRFARRSFKYGALLLILLFVCYGLIDGIEAITDRYAHLESGRKTEPPEKPPIVKKDIGKLLPPRSFFNLRENPLSLAVDGRNLRIDTTLDLTLQKYLLDMLKNLKRETTKYIGIVVMEPSTGRVLSMVGYDKADPLGNPCIDSRFPAASIFKIVTAAAAIEKCGLQPDSQFSYTGRKYTLYKSQLKNRVSKYSNRISLKDSFAQSVNPVFGKIGIHYLGKTTLQQYAEAFGFNRQINFEIPLAPSRIDLTDEPYQWAEIASGFNRITTISPLHGALLISAILNSGTMIEPAIVDRILDENGQPLYRNHPVSIRRAVTLETSEVVTRLMGATVTSGTSRKAFSGRKKDRVLSRLNIGGKTGSIDNKTHDARIDWFVGFAKEVDGSTAVAVSVVVAHEKYIGIRAAYYARLAIKQYFQNYFKKKEA